jgi:hypothetical protein
MPFPAPFGERWEHLTLTDVEAFLATAGEGALTWECKAGRARPEQIVRTAAGFANSELGGYLILGADWVGGAWVLTGADLVPDVTAWLGTAVDRLAPRPHHDARTFTIEATGVRIAVLAIEPVDVPPCLTPDGAVFERVVGQTVPVRDPGRLATLFARGEAAERKAIDAVNAAILEVVKPAGAIIARMPAVFSWSRDKVASSGRTR